MSVIPGAIVQVNDDITCTNINKIAVQLHIDEVLCACEFDAIMAADPDYAHNVRVLNRRVMVLRSPQDPNRYTADVVIYTKHGLAMVEKNCFGPPRQTYPIKNLYWGHLCIFQMDPNRTCMNNECSCRCGPGTDCHHYYNPYAHEGDKYRHDQYHVFRSENGNRFACRQTWLDNPIDMTHVDLTPK